jgi:ubiquinol-cytochrome c reductase cytochrome b subunit
VLGKLCNWLDHRTGYRKFMEAMLLEHIPGGAKWRYVWGSTLAFVFMIQLVTGILLMTAYSPGDSTAWGSVYFIQYEMDFGWLIRGLHHFGSQTMVVLLGLHMLQVVIAGAHLPPREVNWWLGLLLMGVVLGLSLTGYLLPWDQKGYWATRVATNIAGKIPYIGEFLQKIVVGGPEYGNATLTRFYALHVGILPATLVVLLVLHITVFRRHGVTAPRGAETAAQNPPPPFASVLRDLVLGGLCLGACLLFDVPPVTTGVIVALFVLFALSRFVTAPQPVAYFWPSQAFRDLVVCLFVFGVMLSLVLYGGHGSKIETPDRPESKRVDWYEVWEGKDWYAWNAKAGKDGLGANLDAPADPDTAGYPARPEWYFLFLFQLLKYFEGPLMLVGTVIIPNGVMLLLFLIPLFGYGRLRKFAHFLGILVVVTILAAAGVLTFLAMADDSPEPLIFGFPNRTPILKSDGTPDLVDPEARRHNKKILDAKDHHQRVQEAEKQAQRAVQLASQGIPEEGGRELMRKDPLTRGSKLFEMNCAVCHKYTVRPGELNLPGFTKGPFKASDLGDWGGYEWTRGLIDKPGDNKYFGLTTLKGMKTWRSKLEKERKKLEMTKEDIDQEEQDFDTVAKWLDPKKEQNPDFAKFGRAKFDENCATCHSYGGEPKQGPDLLGYGTKEWLRLMIMSPAHPKRHSRHNDMPAFRPAPNSGPGAEVHELEFFGAVPEFPKDKIMQLSDIDRELIIRWMTRDDRVVFGGQTISAPPKK